MTIPICKEKVASTRILGDLNNNRATAQNNSSQMLNSTEVNSLADINHYTTNALDFKTISNISVGYISTVRKTKIERTQTLSEYLQDIKTGKYKSEVEAYHSYIATLIPIEVKSNAVKQRKASVPCCVPHSYCTTATINDKLPQNGIMQVDIDFPSIGNLYVSSDEIKAVLDECPYIFAYHKSIGGTGFVGYAYTQDAINNAFWVIANELQMQGLYVDLSKGVGTGEKRFMSYDADLVIKEQFEAVKSVPGINKGSIVNGYTWHKSSSTRLVTAAEHAFENWVEKNGGFDWTSTGPASPAGLLASVVAQHKHELNQDDLMQLADWCVYLYNKEIIVQEDRHSWEQYLFRFGKYEMNAASNGVASTNCTKNSAVASAEDSAISWSLVLPGLAVHNCTTTLTSPLLDIHNGIREMLGEEKVEEEEVREVVRESKIQCSSAISANVKGELMGVLHYDFRLQSLPALISNGDCTMLFGCSANSARAVLGTGSDAVWLYSTEPQIGNRNSLSLDLDNQRLTYNPFAKLPEVVNVNNITTDADCEWALWTLFESLAGSRDEGELLLDYLAAHWQGLAKGKHQRNRVNDIVIVGEPATGKDLFFDVLTRSFPAVYSTMTDADLHPECKGNDILFTSSLLLMNEAEGSRLKIDNATFKQFCDSANWRYRGMRVGAVDRPRVGLCIRACNKLGLTVDGSTARKIAFFQSGPSTYDMETQKPLDPDKSSRLLSILNTGNFILWFRELLSCRQVDVSKVIYGHGCTKFRANDASKLYNLLKAIEEGETNIEMSGLCNYSIGIKVLNEYIRKSTASHEAGERPSVKINEMIKTGQLEWEEVRYPNGRLCGYKIPLPKVVLTVRQPLPAVDTTIEGSDSTPNSGVRYIRKYDPTKLSRYAN